MLGVNKDHRAEAVCATTAYLKGMNLSHNQILSLLKAMNEKKPSAAQ